MAQRQPLRVVLVGGGYTSIWAYRAVRRRLGGRAQITVVSPADAHVFHGWTGEVLAGELPARAQETPLVEACPRAVYVQGTVVAIDREARQVAVRTSEGEQRLTYDHLVLG